MALDGASRAAAFSLAHEARSRGLAVDLDYMGRSPKGQMKQAGKSGARYAFIIGEEELGGGTVTVRDLTRGEEERVPRGEVLDILEKAD